MKLLALNCNRCGAPLEVPQKAKFITCTFCQTQLSIQRSGGAAYTEALEELGERTEQLKQADADPPNPHDKETEDAKRHGAKQYVSRKIVSRL